MAANSVQSYDKGTVLFVPGDPAQAVYFVLEGTIIATGGEQEISLGVGGILGDVAFFREMNHTYAAVCATDVKVLELNKKNITGVFATQPRIACSLLQELAAKVGDQRIMDFFLGVQEAKKEGPDTSADLLPEGHPKFNARVPAEHYEYLFSTEVECPICATTFAGLRMRTTRLQVERHETDFRAIYRDFEPNFYYIWVCPQCLFAYPERQYGRIRHAVIERAREQLQKNPPPFSFAFDAQRTVQQVITAYYLAMRTFEIVGASPEQWANLWLRLVWIYEDLEEEQLALTAAAKAREYFAEAMSTTARSAAGDQQLYILLGELDLRLGKGGEAFRSFHAAATMTGGDPRNKRMAYDRIQELRQLQSAAEIRFKSNRG